MPEIADAYAGCRLRVGELTRRLSVEQASARVPCCPEWTVHDVVAHMAGVVSDVLAGRLDGVATDPWTHAQVEAGRHRQVAELLDQWDEQAPVFEGFLDGVGDPGRQAVADLATHEHDIRGALGQAGARDSDAVAVAIGFLAPALVGSAAARGVVLRVETGDDSFGSDDAVTVLRADRWELMRAATGRRSLEQLRDLDWSGFDEAVLQAFEFGPFTPADAPILE